MTLNGYFADRKRRQMAVLIAAAVLSGLAALFALHRRAAEVAPTYDTHLLFPDLAHALNAGQVNRIRVSSRAGGTFDVDFVPQKGWILPGRSNYPASFDEVRHVLVAMAAMETVEPKTDQPGWFHYIDVDAPPKGNGTEITVSGDKNHVFAALIVGKTQDIGDESGGVGLFVRKPNENQSWLVRSPAEIKPSQTDWIDKTVMDIDRERVAQADVHPVSGPPYSVSRAAPTVASFTLSPIPKGREIAYAGAGDNIASALDDFTFDDIRPAGDFDFDKGASSLTERTFDGLTVTADVIKQGDDYWARVSAEASPGAAKAAREAYKINERGAGWAFKLASWKGAVFVAPLESLLKPVEKPKK
ncbi:MAG TPA: DUF4340 domain-containing protein [Rhizomicrobium sp.]|nr:DUF4340 domain-containing protein [Rhizomicrobium sp.]